MKKNYTFYFDPDTRIMYKYYYGEISFDDIESSWDEAINKNIIPGETSGFILDYQKASVNIPVKLYNQIPEYYKQHLDIFGGKRIAVLTTNPKDIVIPILVETESQGFESKPFSTEEAAIKWILKK